MCIENRFVGDGEQISVAHFSSVICLRGAMRKLVIIAVMLGLALPVYGKNAPVLASELVEQASSAPSVTKQKKSMGPAALTGIVVGVAVAVVGVGLATAQATKTIDMRTWFKRPDVPVLAPEENLAPVAPDVAGVPGNNREKQAPAAPVPVVVPVRPVKPRIEPSEAVLAAGRAAIARLEKNK